MISLNKLLCVIRDKDRKASDTVKIIVNNLWQITYGLTLPGPPPPTGLGAFDSIGSFSFNLFFDQLNGFKQSDF